MGGSNQQQRWSPRNLQFWRGGIGRCLIMACLMVPQAGMASLYRFDDSGYLGAAQLMPDLSDTLRRPHDAGSDLIRCSAGERACERRKKSLHVLLTKARALSPDRQIKLINRYVNKRRYRRDRTTRLVTDLADEPVKYRSRWSTVGEFLRRGGDCEDYATTKYFLLRELGFTAEQLRVVVTYDRSARAHHAVLALERDDDEVWLLETDNSIKTRSHSGYRYIYAMNENSIWDHAESTARSAGGR